MSSGVDFEIRPDFGLTPRQRAERHHEQMQEFERNFSDWVSIARTCVLIDRDREWELLGYGSFGQYIVAVAPKSRSYLYLVMGRYRELVPDIPEDELQKIPLGTAGVLRMLPSSARRQSKIRQAAAMRPAEFRKIVAELAPDQLIEQIINIKLRFTVSQWEVIAAKYEILRQGDPGLSFEEFVEQLCAE